MPWPTPQRARTASVVLAAVAAVLLASDLAVARWTGDTADVSTYQIVAGNVTAVGIRVTNAGPGDMVRIPEMPSTVACGYVFRTPTLGNESMAERRMSANVTLYVLESHDTAALLRGSPVEPYREERRDGSAGRMGALGDGAATSEATDAGGWTVHVASPDCRTTIELRRGPVSRAEVPDLPGLQGAGMRPGVDVVYVLRAQGEDDANYTLLSERLRSDAQQWEERTRSTAIVQHEAGLVADRWLRAAFAIALATALACLAFSLRVPPAGNPPVATDAALAVVAAGEGHLRRLQRAWILVGTLLLALLSFATAFVVAFDDVPPALHWDLHVFVGIVALDVTMLTLWAMVLRGIRRDLRDWRRAWTNLDAADVDGL